MGKWRNGVMQVIDDLEKEMQAYCIDHGGKEDDFYIPKKGKLAFLRSAEKHREIPIAALVEAYRQAFKQIIDQNRLFGEVMELVDFEFKLPIN